MKLIPSLLAFVIFFSAAMVLSFENVNGSNGAKTQICMVIDGSSSISSAEWAIIKDALAEAINDTVPHDGSVELTIVQFGYSTGIYARTEVLPTIIDRSNFELVANQVLAISKSGGSTPTAHGLFLGWKELSESPNFAVATRQVINLATDETPNVRNDNATTDLDGNGKIDAEDDVIAVVNYAASQGLDELDVEAIGLTTTGKEWFREHVLLPQPGVLAPPFSKAGWVRPVANATEFASTIGEKLQAVIGSYNGLWVPSLEGAAAAGILSVGLTSIVSSLSSAVNDPSGFPSQVLAQKINGLFPETLKKWLQDFVSAKRKLVIKHNLGSIFLLTKKEALSYIAALTVLTLSFAYAKAEKLEQIPALLPIILATSIIVEFAKNYVVEITARKQGVWTEHHLWYFGTFMFLATTLAFKTPFSSPSRIVHHAPRFTKRSLGLVACASVFVGLGLTAFFYILLSTPFASIGSIGIVMCLTMAFFESMPIPPMNGKDIYNWSKMLWVTLFVVTSSLYVLCLLTF